MSVRRLSNGELRARAARLLRRAREFRRLHFYTNPIDRERDPDLWCEAARIHRQYIETARVHREAAEGRR